MTAKLTVFLASLILLGSILAPSSVNAQTPPDELANYTIIITPQPDGTLNMIYQLQDYCVKSPWPADIPYLQVGVPNSSFTITDWSPKGSFVTDVKPITIGGSFAQFDFSPLPLDGSCFDLSFTITQGKMAFPTTDGTNQVTFKFIPAGWDFPINVASLTVIWEKPDDASLLKLSEPGPMATDGNNMVWTWASPVMASNGMFNDYAVKMSYDQAAFSLIEEATTTSDNGNGGSNIDASMVLFIILVVVLGLLIVFVVLSLLSGSSSSGGYYSGGGLGGGGGGGRRGGGGGGGGGRGFGCAASSCACACACAGGSRVGCSRKGIGVQCVKTVVGQMTGGKHVAHAPDSGPAA